MSIDSISSGEECFGFAPVEPPEDQTTVCESIPQEEETSSEEGILRLKGEEDLYLATHRSQTCSALNHYAATITPMPSLTLLFFIEDVAYHLKYDADLSLEEKLSLLQDLKTRAKELDAEDSYYLALEDIYEVEVSLTPSQFDALSKEFQLALPTSAYAYYIDWICDHLLHFTSALTVEEKLSKLQEMKTLLKKIDSEELYYQTLDSIYECETILSPANFVEISESYLDAFQKEHDEYYLYSIINNIVSQCWYLASNVKQCFETLKNSAYAMHSQEYRYRVFAIIYHEEMSSGRSIVDIFKEFAPLLLSLNHPIDYLCDFIDYLPYDLDLSQEDLSELLQQLQAFTEKTGWDWRLELLANRLNNLQT